MSEETADAKGLFNNEVRIKGTVEGAPETPTSPMKEASPMAPIEKG